MQVESFLENSAARFPDKTALVCGSRRLSYQELDQSANRLAHSLAGRGVERDDRVVVYLENSVEAVAAVFGILKAGGVFAVVNPTTKAAKLEYILNNCRATAVLTDRARLETLRACADTPFLRAVWVAGLDAAEADSRAIPLDPVLEQGEGGEHPPRRGIDIDLAALIYTSGSTGRPKGVMLTHHNIVSAATSITTYLENTPDDIILNVLPLSFDYGLYQALMAFLVGGTLVLERSFGYPHAVLQTILRERVTGFPIVPTICAILLQMDLRKYGLPSLRYLTNTAAALPVDHIRRLQESLPHVRIFSMYGLTECKRVSYLPPEQLAVRPGSVGRGMPNEEVFLVDDAGRRLPPGSTGELVVRGSNVMQGYWELPAETDRMLRPGRYPAERLLYTGDLFRSDEEGYLYFLGRKDDIIKTRGEKVSPKEIEEVLHELEAVAEAAVIGVPDPVLGQAIRAVIRVKPGHALSAQEVLSHCARRLEDFMVPKAVEFREELPTTSSGKVAKRELARQIAEGNGFSPEVLRLDAAAECARLEQEIRRMVFEELRRKGVVVGLSGGVDSAVVAAIASRALGKGRVLGLMMPEAESPSESLTLARAVAAWLGLETREEDISPLLAAAGCYQRRDEAIRSVLPDYGPGCKCKIVMADVVANATYPVFSVVAQFPDGTLARARLTAEAYRAVVAATSFKQRTRKMLEYYYADLLTYAVAGTPNRLEYDQGFFVKNGDGAADLKPIAHLYKTQVYALARHLGVPREVTQRPPSTDTYPLPQSQEEFFFALPPEKMDLCLYARDHELTPEAVAPAVALSPEQVSRVYRMIDAKRKASRYLHLAPLVPAG
jgi:NAD+ synthetase